jgi:hypothetical protein
MKFIPADDRIGQLKKKGINPMAFELGDVIQSGAIWKAQRFLISGVQGLGKTTFGATFDRPILIQVEDGAGAINVSTFPEQVKSYADMEAAIRALHGDHNFATAIIDSVDWLEPLVWAELIAKEPSNDKGKRVANIEDYGFGKGYVKALAYWRWLMNGLESLRDNKGMNVVLLAHTEIKRFDPPDSDPYDRYVLKLHKGASALLQEWADNVFFCNFETRIEKTDVGFGKEKKRGTGTGERVIFTEERPAFLAKNRWGLPPKIFIGNDKTWSVFHDAMYEATAGRYPLPEALAREASVVEPPPPVEPTVVGDRPPGGVNAEQF